MYRSVVSQTKAVGGRVTGHMKACCLLLSRQAIDSCSVGEKFVSVLSMASSLGLS